MRGIEEIKSEISLRVERVLGVDRVKGSLWQRLKDLKILRHGKKQGN